MNTKQRRETLLNLLKNETNPISATTIGEQFEVSRQIIVGDVALLRASGHDIVATSSGYVLSKKDGENENSYTISCRHSKVSLEEELYTIVDYGGIVVDVSVEHPIYGNITQPLNIASRYDADSFLKEVTITGGALLSSMTDGAHLHTINCSNPEAYRRILAKLREKGILHI